MALEGYGAQVSYNVAGTMFNVRGESVDHLISEVSKFREQIDFLLETADVLRQVGLAKDLVTPSAPPPAKTHAAPASGSTPAALRCQHGPYKDMNGRVKKSGQGYQYRYYCSQFEGGCDAASLPGQERWSRD